MSHGVAVGVAEQREVDGDTHAGEDQGTAGSEAVRVVPDSQSGFVTSRP
jgi:hypothetical protein